MNEGIQTTMPVQPANAYPPIVYGGGNNGGFGDGNNAWWVIILLLAMGRGWGGYGGGYGDGGGNTPYIINTSSSESGTGRGNWQDGFDHAAVMSGLDGLRTTTSAGFGDTALGISGLGRQICETGGNVTAAVTNGFAQAEIANGGRHSNLMQQLYGNEIANLNRSFDAQTANTAGITGLSRQFADCCCENRLATEQTKALILSENCADRAALSDGIRDIITNQSANTQRILDQMCQDKIDAKNEKIAELERKLLVANLAAAQGAQTSRILADNAAQTQALEQYLNPVPIPAYLVSNPRCCGNQAGFNPGFGNVGFGNGTF